MATPYVTPAMITTAPTGVSWSIVPWPEATNQQQLAEQTNICWRATGMVNAFCNQVLRATIDTEHQAGPDYWLTVQQATGIGRIILRRFPVLNVLQVAVASAATFPRQWNVLPTNSYDVNVPVIGSYGTIAPSAAGDGGQSISIAPGYIDWSLGRNGYVASVTYDNGWPHAGLTSTVTAGASTVQIDDVTGFTGTNAFIFDGASTESVTINTVTATAPVTLPFGGTVPSGPGTVTLTTPLAFNHASGVIISTMPQDIMWATIMMCSAQALEAGIISISIQNISGSETSGGKGIEELLTEAEVILSPYKRIL